MISFCLYFALLLSQVAHTTKMTSAGASWLCPLMTGGDIGGQSESYLCLVEIVLVLDKTRPWGIQSPVLRNMGIEYGLSDFLVASGRFSYRFPSKLQGKIM